MEDASSPDRKTDQVGMLRVQFWIACHPGQWQLAHALAETQLRLTRECGLFVVLFESYMLLAYVCAQTQRKAQMEAALADVDALIGQTRASRRYEPFVRRPARIHEPGSVPGGNLAGIAESREDDGRAGKAQGEAKSRKPPELDA